MANANLPLFEEYSKPYLTMYLKPPGSSSSSSSPQQVRKQMHFFFLSESAFVDYRRRRRGRVEAARSHYFVWGKATRQK